MGANDEFTAFQKAVLKTPAADLDRECAHAEVAWEFLLGFAAKKNMYRGHIAKAIDALMAAPGWKAAFARRPDLVEKAGLLHQDVRTALQLSEGGAPQPDAAPAPATPQAKGSTEASERSQTASAPTEEVEAITWPNFDDMFAIVQLSSYDLGAGEFALLLRKAKQASPTDFDAQAEHAAVAWEFLFGFAQEKPLFVSQVRETIQKLLAVDSWRKALEASPRLLEKISALPAELRTALKGVDMSQLAESTEQAAAKVSDESAQFSPPPRGDEPPAAVPSLVVGRVLPYVQRASQLEASEPVVAYYCRVHAAEVLLKARRAGDRCEELRALLLQTLEDAELSKKTVGLVRRPGLHGVIRTSNFCASSCCRCSLCRSGRRRQCQGVRPIVHRQPVHGCARSVPRRQVTF